MLRSMGYSELDVEGPGIIMNEAEIKYVKEAFAGDILTVDLHVGNFSAVGCSIYYNIRIIDKVIAVVRTGIVFTITTAEKWCGFLRYFSNGLMII